MTNKHVLFELKGHWIKTVINNCYVLYNINKQKHSYIDDKCYAVYPKQCQEICTLTHILTPEKTNYLRFWSNLAYNI